jgi:hypothetical protein
MEQTLRAAVDKLLAEIQEMLRNTTYRDGHATSLAQDIEAVEEQYNNVRQLRNAQEGK